MTRQTMSTALQDLLVSKVPGQVFLMTVSPSTGAEYYTTHGSIIVSNGNSYLPLAGTISGFEYGSNGLNSVNIDIGNIDNKLTDWQAAGELQGMAVTIAVANIDAPDDSTVIMSGRVVTAALTKSAGQIEVMTADAYYSRKKGRVLGELCWKRYGSSECGATPDATYPTCPYTAAGCLERSNEDNFGGLPPITWSKL